MKLLTITKILKGEISSTQKHYFKCSIFQILLKYPSWKIAKRRCPQLWNTTFHSTDHSKSPEWLEAPPRQPPYGQLTQYSKPDQILLRKYNRSLCPVPLCALQLFEPAIPPFLRINTHRVQSKLPALNHGWYISSYLAYSDKGKVKDILCKWLT